MKPEALTSEAKKILPRLDKIKEIAEMKAYSIGRRATYKDYVDLYFVVKEKITTLEEIIESCEEKYGEKFDKRILLEQLVYLEDLQEENIKFLGEEVEGEEIQDFFENRIKQTEV